MTLIYMPYCDDGLINPDCVTEIYVTKFHRCGKHPLFFKFFKRKHPYITWIFGAGAQIGDRVVGCEVVIKSGSHTLRRINCQSYVKAWKVVDEISKSLQLAHS